MDIISFIKKLRKLNKMSQRDLADRAGVGIHFIRDLERGKKTLRMDKVNQVLALFGMELGPVRKQRVSSENTPE
ncbi:MAG: helix-turn-helix domain-containing protein [Candidatus Hydrothermarchaeales archaeon]